MYIVATGMEVARRREAEVVLRVCGLSKAFGGTVALDGVDLEIQEGEVHALVGQNGSGKSTLIKILSGYHRADRGQVSVLGREVRLPLEPSALRGLGISFVHQDLGLVPSGTVLENLRVGRYETGPSGNIRWRSERKTARELLARFDLHLDADEKVARLRPTERAVLAVARAVADVEAARGRGLLVLDEPTTALPAHEVELLFEAVRRVTEAGSAVLFITHNLDEVLAVADRVSVLRDARLVATEPVAGLDEDSLIALILGRELGELYPELPARERDPVMVIRGLGGRVAHDVSLTLRSGEIVGLTGLIGAGHDEVPYLIYGARRPTAGTIEIDGKEWTYPTPQRSKAAGVALLPADRQGQSAIPSATVRENVTLPDMAAYRRWRGLDRRRERADVRRDLERFAVRPSQSERQLYSLSGGNQQKALLARWLRLSPRVLLLHEPTQGVDIGARRGIFRILRDSALDGASILYSSVEYEDLANICDRVLVFRRGSIIGDLAGDALSAERLAERCYSGEKAA
jgi:ribose transport system ATP-binding protein